LIDAPDSIRVATQDGIEIPVVSRNILVVRQDKENSKFISTTTKEISLRSNRSYILHLKYKDKEKVISLYPKLGIGWLFLDLICGILPSFYDAHTGNWNYFPDVDASF